MSGLVGGAVGSGLGRVLQIGGGIMGVAAPFSSIISEALGPDSPIAGLFAQPRKIDTIIPDVTIEENFTDRVQVTQHPVGSTSPIHDHAFLLPRTISMRCGWTNAAPITAAIQGGISGFQSGGGFGDLGGGIGGALTGAGKGLLSSLTEQRAKDIYNKLLALQYSSGVGGTAANKQDPVKPFTLTCGKRNYTNVVITEITVRNDKSTEYALIAEIKMEALNIVSASVSVSAGTGAQANPASTAPTTQGGTQQAKPVPESFFHSTFAPGQGNAPWGRFGGGLFGGGQ